MRMPVVFPVPKRIEGGDNPVVLAKSGEPLWIFTGSPELAVAAEYVARRAEALGFGVQAAPNASGAAVALAVDSMPLPKGTRNADQAYRLAAEGGRVVATGASPAGALWSAQTIAKLLQVTPDGSLTVPNVHVIDWPDMAYRGLFCESRWGPDLMSLQDWQDAIDYLVDLKYNVLTVGVYNCWPIQYYGRVSEWLMVPIQGLPVLKSPQRVDYYSPTAQDWVSKEYLPRMFEEDFFGDLVAYGAKRNMVVRPHFNTPGHNSLIPRLIPEISALDENGRPTGYGFCIHNPRTYEVMFAIVDEICGRYLLPNGVRSYHIAGDEVYPLRGMNPDRPREVLSPWCRCPQCREHTEGELYVEYIVRLTSHLRELGIEHISMWYDQLVRGGQLNEELVARLEQAGVSDALILHWWTYWDFFDTTHPEFGFRRWVTPMTGYFYQTTYRGQLRNIYLSCRKGEEESCEGNEAYGLFDRSFDRHFVELGEMAWNSSVGRTPEEFIQLYAQEVFGDDWIRGLDALRIFGTLVDSLAAHHLTYSMYRYSHDYAQSAEQCTARDNYPQYTVTRLAQAPPWNAEGPFGALSAEAKLARAKFAEARWRRAELRDLYLIECDRLAVMADALTTCISLVRNYERARAGNMRPDVLAREGELLTAGSASLAGVAERFDDVMARAEEQKDAYLVPHFLREMSLLRAFVVNLRASFDTLAQEAREGDLKRLPELAVLKISEVQFPD